MNQKKEKNAKKRKKKAYGKVESRKTGAFPLSHRPYCYQFRSLDRFIRLRETFDAAKNRS
ncbi:MAG TPA: hypothetical protein VGK99_11420 [Acidobacteriota bacterium]